jgi:hypothetical protein
MVCGVKRLLLNVDRIYNRPIGNQLLHSPVEKIAARDRRPLEDSWQTFSELALAPFGGARSSLADCRAADAWIE